MIHRLPLLFLIACAGPSSVESELPEPGADYPRPEDSPQVVQETFPVPTVGELDMLFVIDSSPSMADEVPSILDMAAATPDLAEASTQDWRLGVVTMDMLDSLHQGKLVQARGVRWVDRDTVDPAGVFAEMCDVGTAGSNQTSGRGAVYSALEVHGGPGGYNEGFRRPDAPLHVVFITDADDESSSITNEEFHDYVVDQTASGPDMLFSAFVTPPGGCPTGSYQGLSYLDLTAEFTGIPWDICDFEYATAVDLAVDATGRPWGMMSLAHLPLVETLEVSTLVNGVAVELDPNRWTYDAVANAVVVDPHDDWAGTEGLLVEYVEHAEPL